MKNYSRKREAILDKVRATDCHPTADELYISLKKEYPDLSLGTVYRNLSLFKKEGSVTTVAVVNGQERFDGHTAPHGHFTCNQCNAVIDVDLQMDQTKLISHIKDNPQFHVEKVDWMAYGICAACLNKQELEEQKN
jgi:Fur family peroxide stress response transcriptional regulator